MRTYKILYNKQQFLFFIIPDHCHLSNESIVDIVKHCFNCPYYIGVRLKVKGVFLMCKYGVKGRNYAPDYRPKMFGEMLRIWNYWRRNWERRKYGRE